MRTVRSGSFVSVSRMWLDEAPKKSGNQHIWATDEFRVEDFCGRSIGCGKLRDRARRCFRGRSMRNLERCWLENVIWFERVTLVVWRLLADEMVGGVIEFVEKVGTTWI